MPRQDAKHSPVIFYFLENLNDIVFDVGRRNYKFWTAESDSLQTNLRLKTTVNLGEIGRKAKEVTSKERMNSLKIKQLVAS